MRKFLWAVLLVLLAAASACQKIKETEKEKEDPGTENPGGNQGDEDYWKDFFVIEAGEVTSGTAEISYTPKDDTTRFYFDVIAKEVFESYHKSSYESFFKGMVDAFMAANPGSTAEEIVEDITVTGKTSHKFEGLSPKTEYIAFSFLLDDEMKPQYPAEMTFSTLEAVSENLFEITILKEEFDNIDFKITPENDDRYYYCIRTAEFCDRRSDEEIIAKIFEEDGYLMEFMATSGETTVERKEGETPFTYFNPDTGYYILVFGYENGTATTGLHKMSARTKNEAGPADNCTFSAEITGLKARSANISITPSDLKLTYIWEVITEEEYQNTDMRQYVEAYAAENIDKLDNIRIYGESGAQLSNVLRPDTKYIVWAVPVDDKGKTMSEVKVAGTFQTPEAQMSQATVEATIEKYFNGDEVYELDKELYAECQGMAYVPVTFTASSDAQTWYGALFEGDITDPEKEGETDEDIISMFDGNFDYMFPTGKLYNCKWDVTYTVLAVARDKDDNYSKVLRIPFVFTKDGAAPISEFQKPE